MKQYKYLIAILLLSGAGGVLLFLNIKEHPQGKEALVKNLKANTLETHKAPHLNENATINKDEAIPSYSKERSPIKDQEEAVTQPLSYPVFQIDPQCENVRQEYIKNLYDEVLIELEQGDSYPSRAHVIQWNSTFQWEDEKVSLEAFWNGDTPPTYNIDYKPSQQTKENSPFARLVIQDHNRLPWEEAKIILKHAEEELKNINTTRINHRLYITRDLPKEGNNKDNTGGEFSNGKLQFFNKANIHCQGNENSMSCQCEFIEG